MKFRDTKNLYMTTNTKMSLIIIKEIYDNDYDYDKSL